MASVGRLPSSEPRAESNLLKRPGFRVAKECTFVLLQRISQLHSPTSRLKVALDASVELDCLCLDLKPVFPRHLTLED